MKQPDADDLIPFMPPSVYEDYVRHGNPSIFGFSDYVKNWITKSTRKEVEQWRNDLKRFTVAQVEVALKEQERMNELTNAFSPTNGLVRHVATIHPVLKRHMETENPHAWSDPAAIADTKKRHRKIFVQ